jgi:hypothetical protein
MEAAVNSHRRQSTIVGQLADHGGTALLSSHKAD